MEKWNVANVLEMANHRAQRSVIWDLGYFDLVVFNVILRIFGRLSQNVLWLQKGAHRVKLYEIWDSGIVYHTGGGGGSV